MNTELIESKAMVKEVQEKLILHWNYRGFTDLPEVVRKYGAHIREIYLKWNQLSNLPRWVAELTNITNLYLHGNQIESLPDEIGDMVHLAALDLGHNRLKTLPRRIGELKNLKILLLNENSMRNLSPEINQLTKIETLSVSGNKLVALPEWLGSLPNLEELIADCNCLMELPNRLTLSPQLSTISVCSNRLQYLPLNGFLSTPCIQFDCNPRLNYLSLPVRYQLRKQNHWVRATGEIPAYRCSDGRVSKKEIDKELKLNICLEVENCGLQNSVVVLPRQLLVVYSINQNCVPSLWELALRRVYCSRFKHTLDISLSTLDVSVDRSKRSIPNTGTEITGYMNELLKNGPASICLGNNCQEPIFTEAWISVDSNSKNPFLQLSVFCSKKCTLDFTESSSTLLSNRSWCII